MKTPEFIFELHACRWAELAWPARESAEWFVGRQLGTRHRRWDTVIFECDPDGFAARRDFGSKHLDSDLLHVVRHAPVEWKWYRDALPDPGYPWRYVRDAVHEAADRGIVEKRKRRGKIEVRQCYEYPTWVERVIAIEHKPDLDASAADALASQLEYDVAMGLADEVWLATLATDTSASPAFFEEMPVEVGILAIDPSTLHSDVLWQPRRLDPTKPGTRILERPRADARDRSAARFEYISPAKKADIRLEIAERAYERGWRSAIDAMRPDCCHFGLASETLTHEPRCEAKGRPQTAAECSGSCTDFAPEPPAWRMKGWPIEGGPGCAARTVMEHQRARYR